MIFAALAILCLTGGSSAEDAKIRCFKAGEQYPYPGDCGRYAVCQQDGYLEVKSCPDQQGYDHARRMCAGVGPETCSDVACLEGDSLPVENSCLAYRYCEAGAWKTSSCFVWQGYDPWMKRCRPGFDCSQTPTICGQDGTVKPTRGLDCLIYMRCKDHRWESTWCREGHFNVDTKQCDKSVECQCISGAKVRVPGQCQQYKQCVRGIYKLMTCADGMKFDKVNNECVPAADAVC